MRMFYILLRSDVFAGWPSIRAIAKLALRTTSGDSQASLLNSHVRLRSKEPKHLA